MAVLTLEPILLLSELSSAARPLTLGCLLVLSPALPSRLAQDPSGVQAADTELLSSRLKSLEEFCSNLDWERVPAAAEALIELVPYGSDGWFVARSRLAQARYQLWQPELLEAEARETLAVAVELRRREPFATRSSLGPLHPKTAGFVMQTELRLARLLQARGLHHEALGHLSLLLDDLRSGPTSRGTELMAEVGLDSARSLLALGRLSSARTALESLRDNFRDQAEGAIAAVILTAIPGVGDPYRGEYEDDAEHTARRSSLLAALPAARARLAERMGRPLTEIPNPLIGVADTPEHHQGVIAFAEVDPRRGDFPPVIVVLSDGVARASFDPVTILVHELAHLVLYQELGVRYEQLPPWLIEGIPQAIADQLDQLALDNLELRLAEDPALFLHPEHWKLRPLQLGVERQGWLHIAGPEASLLMLSLVLDSPGGLEPFLEHLRRGADLEEALLEATGLGLEAYELQARVRAQAFLEERRARSMPGLVALERAQLGAPEATIELTGDMLGKQQPPLLRGWTLWVRAQALEHAGRTEEAVLAWRELADRRVEHGALLDFAVYSQALCLMRLGRATEARPLLIELGRWTANPAVRQRVGEYLEQIDAGDR